MTTREGSRDLIKLLQHFADGGTIEVRSKPTVENLEPRWSRTTGNAAELAWNFSSFEYRAIFPPAERYAVRDKHGDFSFRVSGQPLISHADAARAVEYYNQNYPSDAPHAVALFREVKNDQQ